MNADKVTTTERTTEGMARSPDHQPAVSMRSVVGLTYAIFAL
jgi:hypothetical protein